MTKQRNAIRAGSFIIVTLVLVAVILVAIRGLSRLFEPTRNLVATFQLADDVGGLKAGDEVRLGGLKVGEIRDIAIQDRKDEHGSGPRVLITFNCPSRYKIHADAVIRIQTSVTGASNLNIESIGHGKELAENDELAGKPATLSETLNDVRTMVVELQGVADDVHNRLVPRATETISKFGSAADSINSVAGRLSTAVDAVEKTAGHTTVAADRAAEALANLRDITGDSKGDLRETIANLAAVSRSAKAKVDDVLNKMTAFIARVDTVVDSANDALKEIRGAVGEVKSVGASANAVLSTNRTRLDDIIASLKATSDNLKNASGEIRHSPWRLLYKPDDSEAGNLDLFDAARQFAEGANDLNDAAQALRDASKAQNVDPERMKALVAKLQNTFEQFSKVQDSLWKKVKE